jgi:hypothetical protein
LREENVEKYFYYLENVVRHKKKATDSRNVEKGTEIKRQRERDRDKGQGQR